MPGHSRLVKLISTFFYVGYLPLMPGTFGSFAGLVVYFFIKNNPLFYFLFTLVLLIIGLWASKEAERVFRKKDPKYVVIDEVVGMLITLFLVPFDLRLILIGFFLFRLFDTLKPFPVSSFQHTKGAIGVMGDDVVAALLANLVLQLLVRFAVFKIS
ncbi:MAG: phosphatidylglycerophosphatase A [Candidatus Omnitrophica bacterium]|nr:phosphatidylglycerophosphatase A [Candidatus Omnitrophota bacterium]MDD5653089.1 phosphatidylglycerophosphatase A [Candidatus Omnitrophota bacterium]